MGDNGSSLPKRPREDEAPAEDGEDAPPLRFAIIPSRHTKVLHLVRHGEGFHNVAVKKAGGDHSLYKSWDFEDAQLTAYGWNQALALKKHIGQMREPLQVQLVVVSPLSRTLQTAVAVFGGGGASQSGDNSRAELLMTAAALEASHHDKSHTGLEAGVSSNGCPPFLAFEECREQIGVHPCDKRRSVSYYKENYPAVDFSLIETEEDVRWSVDKRETLPEIKARATKFLQWVMTRPETHIAVVAHSAFLTRGLLPQFGHEYSNGVREDMQAYFQNCEMRSMVLLDGNGGGGVQRQKDPLWFPGGPECAVGAWERGT